MNMRAEDSSKTERYERGDKRRRRTHAGAVEGASPQLQTDVASGFDKFRPRFSSNIMKDMDEMIAKDIDERKRIVKDIDEHKSISTLWGSDKRRYPRYYQIPFFPSSPSPSLQIIFLCLHAKFMKRCI